MVFVRNPQVRFTYKKGPHELAVAIEKPSNDVDPGDIRIIDPTLGANIRGDEKIPDFTAHYRYDGKWGHVQIAGVLRSVGFDTLNTVDNEPKNSKLGWGVNLAGNINTWGKDVLHLSAVYGHGIASYMNDGGVDLAPANNALTHAEALPLLGWLAYYNHTWNDKWTSSIGFSENRQWNTSGQTDDAFETGQYGSVNLLYHPVPEMLIGPEFLWGRRENHNNDSETDNRIQLSVKYDFSGRVFGAESER